MKKFIVPGVVLSVFALLVAGGCEEEENATLSVLNRMGFTVSHFSLKEFNGGENLLPAGEVLEDTPPWQPWLSPMSSRRGHPTTA